ncbi:hypothetical protein FA13DRAFT_1894851 [Coprinellus micaceus]|uniref:Uncharacterized protein n=1 Tax=Coprinellus micaceus TaxID=71717 RepID=A0A4Y7SW61_COPMI|nr:hypothetical protein FA13DRAFT_1894851 [Coprinellus micaceus]
MSAVGTGVAVAEAKAPFGKSVLEPTLWPEAAPRGCTDPLFGWVYGITSSQSGLGELAESNYCLVVAVTGYLAKYSKSVTTTGELQDGKKSVLLLFVGDRPAIIPAPSARINPETGRGNLGWEPEHPGTDTANAGVGAGASADADARPVLAHIWSLRTMVRQTSAWECLASSYNGTANADAGVDGTPVLSMVGDMTHMRMWMRKGTNADCDWVPIRCGDSDNAG